MPASKHCDCSFLHLRDQAPAWCLTLSCALLPCSDPNSGRIARGNHLPAWAIALIAIGAVLTVAGAAMIGFLVYRWAGCTPKQQLHMLWACSLQHRHLGRARTAPCLAAAAAAGTRSCVLPQQGAQGPALLQAVAGGRDRPCSDLSSGAAGGSSSSSRSRSGSRSGRGRSKSLQGASNGWAGARQHAVRALLHAVAFVLHSCRPAPPRWRHT